MPKVYIPVSSYPVSCLIIMLTRSAVRALTDLTNWYVLLITGRSVVVFDDPLGYQWSMSRKYHRMSSWRYLMLTDNSINFSPVMNMYGTAEMGGSSSHMCAEVGDVSCISHPPICMCTCCLLQTGLRA